jgi:PPIC-type PPIASE domain
MHLSRSLCATFTIGLLLAASACSNLTSPPGEDPDSLPQVGNNAETPPTPNQPKQPRLLPNKAAERGGNRNVAMIRRILVAYKGATGAKPEIKRSKQEAKKLAVDLAAKLKQPNADFGALAKKHSDAPDAARGGILPAFKRDSDMDATLKAAAFKTAVGQFSGVINTDQGFLILQRLK